MNASKIPPLRNSLRDSIVRIRFAKKNGDHTDAMATQDPSRIPDYKEPEFSASFIKVFCVERQRWTTIPFANILE